MLHEIIEFLGPQTARHLLVEEVLDNALGERRFALRELVERTPPVDDVGAGSMVDLLAQAVIDAAALCAVRVPEPIRCR